MTSQAIDIAEEFFRELQTSICSAVEHMDESASFLKDPWEHATGGGGLTRVIQDGSCFEKGAVNFSRVSSPLSPDAAARMKVSSRTISATGISLILHPQNPFVPTVHANFRYLELDDGTWWFGGGADLTPFYLFEEDAQHFHSVLKRACDSQNASYYERFKDWCDSYFYLPHRKETRGIGGIFFDDLTGDFSTLFSFVQACGGAFIEAYLPLVSKRASMPFNDTHRTWQLQRRGRYAEFNLVYDRGTKFGLDTGGRIESILVSMPPVARWDYDVVPVSGSEEHKLVSVLQSPQTWV